MSTKHSKYEAVIGLEVHCQLLTKSKLFSGSSAAFGGPPNSQVDPVCLGLPGVLPVLNRQAVAYAVKMGLATQCKIANRSVFARKNYFYPDLPKGYQISQFEEPLCTAGCLEIAVQGKRRKIGITRIHLEEDAGKSVHDEAFVGEDETLVDLNRAGVPLIEIVSQPDIRSAEEAAAYLTELRRIVQYLEICDGNMEEGSLRCDANISVRPYGQHELGVKTELKNLNSIRGVQKAVEFEIMRQAEILSAGGEIEQQTLLWDENRNETIVMRTKEESDDYRYFPDPDLPPLQVDEDWIANIRASLPELPAARQARLTAEYQIPDYDAGVLTTSKELADYYEKVAQLSKDPKAASNWIMGEVRREMNERQIPSSEIGVSSADLAELIKLVKGGAISGRTAKAVFADMVTTGKNPEAIVQEKGLVQISDTAEIEDQVKKILDDNPAEVAKYLAGNEQVLGFFVGQVMRATRGQANPKLVNQTLRQALQER